MILLQVFEQRATAQAACNSWVDQAVEAGALGPCAHNSSRYPVTFFVYSMTVLIGESKIA
jgi:hypothetical protein